MIAEMKKTTQLLAAYLLLTAILSGCSQQDNGANVAPAGTTMEDLKAQSEKIAADKEKQEIEKAKVDADMARIEAEKDRWSYSTNIDKMTSKTTRYAHITAENVFNFAFPYTGDTDSRLMIRQSASSGLDILFSVSQGQIICMQSCSINARFDDKPAIRFTGDHPADYSSNQIFLSPASKFLSELKKSKKVFIEVTYYSAGSRISEFKSDGLRWESKMGK